jgi:hypothetical protein
MNSKRHLRAGLFGVPDFRKYKGSSGTNTVETQSGPPAQVLANYEQVYQQGQNVANSPYQPYNGSVVAGFTPMQQAGFNAVNTAANAGQPFINQASQDVTNSTNALNAQNFGGTVAQYQSPYTQQVVNATEAQMNNQNAIQQNQLAGNAASSGAFGGDRQAVAQAVLGGQQQAQEAPTIANLYNTGFQNATSAAQSNAWLNSQGGFSMGNLGQEAQNQGETAANSMLSAGSTQQQQAQNQLNVPYESYLAAQAYPFQTTSWLGNLAEGTGSLSGGTSSTTSPGSSTLSELAGLGLSTAGILGGTGAFGSSGWLAGLLARGGRVPEYASGGQPYDPLNFAGGVPDLSITLMPSASASSSGHGSTIPRVPQASQNQSLLQEVKGAGLSGMGNMRGTFGSPTSDANAQAINAMQTAAPDFGAMGSWGGDAYSYPSSRGGRVDFGTHRPLRLGLGDAVFPRRTRGGLIPLRRDVGGAAGESQTPAGLTASVGGNPAMVQLTQAYSGLPTEQLQEMAAKFPPNSAQGSMVQRALRMRQMNPSANPAQPQVPSGQPAGQAQQQAGFAPQGMADGGEPVQDPDAPWAAAVGVPSAVPFNVGNPVPRAMRTSGWQSNIGDEVVGAVPQQVGGLSSINDGFSDQPPPSPPPPPTRRAGVGSDATISYLQPEGGLRAIPADAYSTDQAPQPANDQQPKSRDFTMDTGASKPSPWEALTAAGLAMMAGRSKFPLENIGQGGLAGLQNYQQQRQLLTQDAIRRQQAEWQNDYRQQMVQNQANRNDNTLAIAQLRSADANARTQQAMQIAMMRMAAGHMSEAEGERTYVQELQKQGYSLPDAIEAAKGFAGRATRSQQGLDLRSDALANTKEYQDRVLALRQQGLSQNAANAQARDEITQRGQDQAATGKVLPRVGAPSTQPAAPSLPPGAPAGARLAPNGDVVVQQNGQWYKWTP